VKSLSASELSRYYGCGLVRFSGHEDALFERHLVFDHVIDPKSAYVRARFEALARSLRDVLSQRWITTQKAYEEKNPKIVYYLSMEFLIGRSMQNNIINLLVDPLVRDALRRHHLDLSQLIEQEPDAGLGNGGLGRLAACFIDSLATLQIPAIGYGLRYQYGIFRQEVREGYQVERPDNWLRRDDPWETVRSEDVVPLQAHSAVRMEGGVPRLIKQENTILGVPYDRPVVGYGGKTINTLRLWEAATPDFFDLGEFNTGDYVGAVFSKVMTENLTRVLYPDDSTQAGQRLRFAQEYFLVACSLADIIARFRQNNNDWHALPDKVAVQLNDTHPSLAVAELMRILLDQAGLGWADAWDLTQRTLAYTNHTLLPEALEKWPVDLFEIVLPRQLEIIYEINRRFLDDVRKRYPDDNDRIRRVSLIEEGARRQVRMAHLAIVGTHSTNGVAAIHSDLLKKTVVPDFAEMYPERFGNKTNGVTPRRWLLLANPALADLITASLGDGWVSNLSLLKELKPMADDASFREAFRKAKRTAKVRFANWLRRSSGLTVDPDSLFDSQIKRIHEYKRQLLNVLHVIILYDRLRLNPTQDVPPRTFFFAGKAAPAYRLAKLIIKLINNVAEVIDRDPVAGDRLRVMFVPDYNVSLAERLIPATDVSEQISTAGFEASGTGNMKFMMNGALTIGTRDGATIEMAEEAGEENFFLFGLTAQQVAASRGWYNPAWHYEHDVETRRAIDLLASNHFSRDEPGIFQPIVETLLRSDHYMHLADLPAYAEAHAAVRNLYRRPDDWARKAIINVACSGKFSSDRTIAEYARDIWNAVPVPVE
jgi:starch phosphorylase